MTGARQPKLDAVDEAIVAVLQEDGRRSYGEIGDAVGLSEAATRQRVNRLRESGAMRIVAVTDPVALGREVVATIGLRIRSIDGVRETETFTHLHTEKNVFAWGQRLPQA